MKKKPVIVEKEGQFYIEITDAKGKVKWVDAGRSRRYAEKLLREMYGD